MFGILSATMKGMGMRSRTRLRTAGLSLVLALVSWTCLVVIVTMGEDARLASMPFRSTTPFLLPPSFQLPNSIYWPGTPVGAWLSDVDCATLLPTETSALTTPCHWGCVDARDSMMVSPLDGTVVCVPPWVGKPCEHHMPDTVERRLLTIQREGSVQ
jgi:hypothetical protein